MNEHQTETDVKTLLLLDDFIGMECEPRYSPRMKLLATSGRNFNLSIPFSSQDLSSDDHRFSYTPESLAHLASLVYLKRYERLSRRHGMRKDSILMLESGKQIRMRGYRKSVAELEHDAHDRFPNEVREHLRRAQIVKSTINVRRRETWPHVTEPLRP